MAANDYYTSSPHRTPYEDYRNAPLPPVPRTHSPYGSTTHLAQPYSPTYSGLGGRFREDDPYEDDNSIPLSGRKKHESATSISPILPHQQEDPLVRDADPRRERRQKGRRRDGWFRGQITWVVYTLTVIQLAVFIAELVKNGKIHHTQQGYTMLI